ncbi:twin-arginine translocation signal domain-containing protein [bacterium CPR1]|nr:twin-arginine translocation signal domain-containing protein [bacterium CPR1]
MDDDTLEESLAGHDQPAMTRRRFLTDCLFAGGALVAAATLARPEPFFEQVLEGQPVASRPAEPLVCPPAAGPTTRRYPSDHDVDVATCAYPSDSDSDRFSVTNAIEDFDQPPVLQAPRKQSSQARPFWSLFSA